MKTKLGFFLTAFLAIPAFACPNFSGHFKVKALLRSFTITQKGCEEFLVVYPPMYPGPSDPQPIHNEYILDGKRHEVGAGYFQSAYWQGDKLIVEDWSNLTNGVLYLRRVWLTKVSGQKTEMFETYFNPSNGALIGSDVYEKIN